MMELINRRAALDAIDKNREALLSSGMTGAEHILVHYGRRVIEELPTIDVPDRKVGKWESNEYLYTTRQTRCSECKTEFYVDDLLNVGEGAQEYLPNFCPHCGARMNEVSDE